MEFRPWLQKIVMTIRFEIILLKRVSLTTVNIFDLKKQLS